MKRKTPRRWQHARHAKEAMLWYAVFPCVWEEQCCYSNNQPLDNDGPGSGLYPEGWGGPFCPPGGPPLPRLLPHYCPKGACRGWPYCPPGAPLLPQHSGAPWNAAGALGNPLVGHTPTASRQHGPRMARALPAPIVATGMHQGPFGMLGRMVGQ